MVLEWTIEVIFDLIVAVFALCSGVMMFIFKDTREIKSLQLVGISLIFNFISHIFEALAVLWLNFYLYSGYSIIIFFSLGFFVAGFNHISKETYISKSLLFIASLGILHIYLSLQLNLYTIIDDYGFPVINWTGLLFVTGHIIYIMASVYVVIWGVKTLLNSPFVVKRGVIWFNIGILIYTITITITYLLSLFINPAIACLIDDIFGGALIIFIYSVTRQPKLLYILPFTIYRIMVRDKDGDPLFDHDWSAFYDKEMNIFAGFLNAMKLMSEKILNIGEPVEIKLEKGLLIIQESYSITTGLVTSKSSKLLRKNLLNFTLAFEEMFQHPLNKSIKDQNAYIKAYELIDRFFSNFAHKLLMNKKNHLLIAPEIPLELEHDLKSKMTGDLEYQSIKYELLKTSDDIVTDYFNLYDELTQGTFEGKKDEIKILDNKKNNSET